MGSAIQDVVSGALFHELRMSTLANNIANVSTVGFKEDRISFKLPEELDATGGADPAMEVGMSPQQSYLGNPVQSYINFSPGQIVRSGNPLDFAIEGKGFFVIQTAEGPRYTRSGNFTLNSDGVLVTPHGQPVMGEGGEIVLDGRRIDVDGAGNIISGGTAVGRLKIVDFPETTDLIKSGKNTFMPASEDVRETEPEAAMVVQGSIELSNVDVVTSMTDMIEVLRGYESYQKVIQFLNEANTKIINEVGTPA